MIKDFLYDAIGRVWSHPAPIDRQQYEKYMSYQNIFRIRYTAFVLGGFAAFMIFKAETHIIYMSQLKMTTNIALIILSLIYFVISVLFTKDIACRPKLSSALSIVFWMTFILLSTPFIIDDMEAHAYLFYYMMIYVMLTLIPVITRKYMPLVFGAFALYSLMLCFLTGAGIEKVIDIIELAVGFCFIDAEVIYRYISAISVLSGSEYELQTSLEVARRDLELSRVKISVSQMQPHFLFNVLTSIQTIMKTEPEYAYDLIYDFTIHLRGLVKAMSSDEPIPFKDEIDNTMAYLSMEKMRLGEHLNIIRDTRDEDFRIIPLSIQPLAENAAKHGIGANGRGGGTIILRSYTAPGFHIIEIEDNGVGFDYKKTIQKSISDDGHGSVGLVNLIFRLKMLMNAEVEVQSRIGIGTKVILKIPAVQAIEADTAAVKN